MLAYPFKEKKNEAMLWLSSFPNFFRSWSNFPTLQKLKGLFWRGHQAGMACALWPRRADAAVDAAL